MTSEAIETIIRSMHARIMESGAASVITIVTGNEGCACSKYAVMGGNVYANLGAMIEQVDILREQGRETVRGNDND